MKILGNFIFSAILADAQRGKTKRILNSKYIINGRNIRNRIQSLTKCRILRILALDCIKKKIFFQTVKSMNL